MDTFLTDYIKAIENPNKIGWNGKVWAAPTLEGYDKNQRGYGIDIKRNIEARNLTKDRLGQWITEKEADTLMNNHLKYIEGVAKRRIKGFDNFSKEKLAAILGMLYRGDSVQSNVNINEPDDMKFLDSVHTYYKSKGLNERASNSENFFLNKTKKRNIPIVNYSFSEYSLPQDNTIVKKPIVFNKLGGYIRKMLTASGGPIRRIKFTPEQIALFESQATRVPGMNNSGGNKYRKEGVLALQHLEQETKRKEEEIKSRMEMRPTLKREATTSEKLQGKKDEYVQTPQVIGMSGADPVGEFVLAGIGLNGIGALAKTGLWNVAKYAPTTLLGNWGRGYFVGNAFKNSFNGAVPTLTSQATSLLYLPVKLNESGLTSLKFFERPTLSNTQELAGVTKWERNFKPKWHVANYPGYLLKGLMKGSLLEKQLSKNGTININLLNAYFNKASQIEKEVANKVLAEKFAGLKTIDYNLFKKAVLDELIGNYNRNYNALSMIPTMTTEKMMAYGGDRLGIIKDFKDIPDGTGGLITTWTNELPVLFKQFTFETPKISIGNRKHYSGQPIGHTRTFINQQEPWILHVMESQSDWAQKSLGLTKAEKTAIQNIDEQLKTGTPTGFSTLEELQAQKQAILDRASQRILGISYLSLYLHDNYLQRLLQENLRYAAENGLTKMRYPTSETAAKIEGYSKTEQTPEFREALAELERLQHLKTTNQMSKAERLLGIRLAIENDRLTSIPDEINIKTGETKYYTPEEKARLIRDVENKLADILILLRDFMYSPLHQTILKKYADFPKLFLKLFKDYKVRTVTDAKGNTWYEVDVPKGYLSKEWLFKQGGKMNIIELFKEGGQIRKMLTAAGGPIKKFRTKDVNGNWVYMDISTGRTTSAAPESGTIRTNTVNSIGGDVKTKLGRTRIALNQVTSYNNRQYKVHNYADTRTRLQLKNQDVVLDKQGEPKIVQADYTPTLEAPMKIVSPEFDLLTLGRLAVTSAYNAAKPTINVMADTAPEVKSATTLSLEQIEKAFNQARQWHLNRINSPGYKDRALRAGFTEEEIPQLLQLLTRLINSLKLQNKEKLFPNNFSYEDNFGKINAEYWRLPTNKGMFLGIGFYNPNMSYDEAVSKFIHEFGHGATFGLNGNETTGLAGKLSKQFPLITKAVLYNKSLFPEVTEETVKKVFPYAAENGKLEYYSRPTELLARGYEFMRDYGNSWWKLKNSKNSFTILNVIDNAKNNRLNSKLFGALTGNLGAYNFQKNALGISAPLGLGGYGLYNNYNLLQQLQYLKQGGMLEFLKNGSGIHIKKKNRGKFTSYCGGKVTDECIRKAKASGNPTLVKRATFAANARHFKHKSGGQIVQEFKRIRKNSLGGFLLGNMDKIQALTGTLGNYINNEKKIPQNPFNGMTAEWLINKKNNPSYNTLEQYPDVLTSPMEAFYTLPNNNEELVYLRNLENAFDIYKNLLKQKNTEALISGIGDIAKSL